MINVNNLYNFNHEQIFIVDQNIIDNINETLVEIEHYTTDTNFETESKSLIDELKINNDLVFKKLVELVSIRGNYRLLKLIKNEYEQLWRNFEANNPRFLYELMEKGVWTVMTGSILFFLELGFIANFENVKDFLLDYNDEITFIEYLPIYLDEKKKQDPFDWHPGKWLNEIVFEYNQNKDPIYTYLIEALLPYCNIYQLISEGYQKAAKILFDIGYYPKHLFNRLCYALFLESTPEAIDQLTEGARLNKCTLPEVVLALLCIPPLQNESPKIELLKLLFFFNVLEYTNNVEEKIDLPSIQKKMLLVQELWHPLIFSISNNHKLHLNALDIVKSINVTVKDPFHNNFESWKNFRDSIKQSLEYISQTTLKG